MTLYRVKYYLFLLPLLLFGAPVWARQNTIEGNGDVYDTLVFNLQAYQEAIQEELNRNTQKKTELENELAISLDRPEWVSNYLNSRPFLRGEETLEECEVVGRSIVPAPDNGLERHMMAVYDALGTYAFYVSTQVKVSGDGSEQKAEASIDYTLLDNWIDKDGYEFVLLRVRPGHHRLEVKFTDSHYSERSEDLMARDVTQGKQEYRFSAFCFPEKYYYEEIYEDGKWTYKALCEIGGFRHVE